MAAEDLTVLIRGRASGLISSFRKVADEAGVTASKTERSFAQAGKAVALAGAAIVGVAGVIAAASVKAATTFESSQARMTTAITNTGGSFKAFAPQIDVANKMMEKFGFTNSQTEDSIASLTAATHSTEKALALQSLAADIARGRNIDLSTATALLTKVVTGHVALLGRLGINTKDASGATISQTEAIQRLSQMYGGQASASAATFGGKVATLKAELTDLAVKVGEAIIPIIERFASFVTGTIVPALQSFGGWIQKNQGFVVGFAAVLGGAALTALTVWVAELVVAAAAEVAALGPLLLLVAAAVEVGAAAQLMGVNWSTVWSDMQTVAINGANAILAVVRQLAHGINAVTDVLDLIPGVNIPSIDVSALQNFGSKKPFYGPVANSGFIASGAGKVPFYGPVANAGFIASGAGDPNNPGLGGFNFNTVGSGIHLPGGASGSSAAARNPAKLVNDFTIALGLLTPNVKFFEKQLEQTIHGVGATSAAAVAAADQFRAAQQSLLASKLDAGDARRNLLLAKNDAPLSRFAITDARQQLITDSQYGADAETLTKDQIALRDAQINAGKGTDDIKRAEIALGSARLAEVANLRSVTSAHRLLNEVLHGFPKNSVQVFTAMGNLARALGGTLGVPTKLQHDGNSLVINIAGHVVTEQQLEQLIAQVLKKASNKQGVLRGVQTAH